MPYIRTVGELQKLIEGLSPETILVKDEDGGDIDMGFAIDAGSDIPDSTTSTIERCRGLIDGYPNIPMPEVRELMEKAENHGVLKVYF